MERTDESRIQTLVSRVLDLDCTPEEACADCPELHWQVSERVAQCQRLDAQLAAMFPDSIDPSASDPALRFDGNSRLPDVAGYVIGSVLGSGGVGVVYEATHVKLSRVVALKMLLAGPYADDRELARFLREARAVAGLQHENIVRVHDVGDVDGRPFFTMEYVGGGTLAAKLAGAPQPARGAAELVRTLARGVHAAHLAGIVHRDLKPSNVLLTAEGVPKISDFGLARRCEGEAGLTHSGLMVGTPSYMAPEQATGKAGAVGPLADVYSLGAILYEMLTGRPPFWADTAVETLRQVISDEPASLARLNSRVPRDLETVCLTCLRKEPGERYPSAIALSEDLDRYLRGEPVAARRAGALERSVKWARRYPYVTAGLATLLLLTLTLIIALARPAIQRSRTRQAVEADLQGVASLEAHERWPEARAALSRAEARLGDADERGALREKVDRVQRDLDLVGALEATRLSRLTSGELTFYQGQANGEYERAFRDAALVTPAGDVEAGADRVRLSPVRRALADALDDWAICAHDGAERGWILDVLRRVDARPSGWRGRVCDPATWDDRRALNELARVVPVDDEPLAMLLAFGERLKRSGGSAMSFFRRVQNAHPGDFRANLMLGDALLLHDPREALGYYRAALASRPDAAVAYSAVGDALRLTSSQSDALDYYQRALALDPAYARAITNRGNTLHDLARDEEAIPCYRDALRIDPNYAWAHADLGNVLIDDAKFDEAIVQYKLFLSQYPQFGWAYSHLATALRGAGKPDEAIDCLRRGVLVDPANAALYRDLGTLLKHAGKSGEAVAYFEAFLASHPACAWANDNLGNALRDVGRAEEAAACYRASIRLDPTYTWAYRDLGKAMQAAGKSGDAVECYETFLRRDAKNFAAQNEVRGALIRLGRSEDVWAAWQASLQAGPTAYEAWSGYPELCLFLGHEDEYARVRSLILTRFGKSNVPVVAEEAARACLLMPASGDELRTAVALARRAEGAPTAKPNARALFVKGLAAYRAGQFDDAIETLAGPASGEMGPCPCLIIAMAREKLGRHADAKTSLALGVSKFDWNAAKAVKRDFWIYYSLRREAERTVASD